MNSIPERDLENLCINTIRMLSADPSPRFHEADVQGKCGARGIGA